MPKKTEQPKTEKQNLGELWPAYAQQVDRVKKMRPVLSRMANFTVHDLCELRDIVNAKIESLAEPQVDPESE